MTYYHNFLDDDFDPRNVAHIDAQASAVGHDHITDMIQEKAKLAKFHAALHLSGQADTPAHEQCLDMVDRINDNITRGFNGVWN
jgi:hypothetical protein